MIRPYRGGIPALLFFGWTMVLFPQDYGTSLSRGISLLSEGKYQDAIEMLVPVATKSTKAEEQGEALYWLGQAYLSKGEYGKSIAAIESLEKVKRPSQRVVEGAYIKGRALYETGQYETSIGVLQDFFSKIEDPIRKSLALFWIGENLFSMGQYSEAEKIYGSLITTYPQSPKYEGARYRLALIQQKQIETELLGLLKWSHEEALRITEEYERRERAYEQALIAYQKRIAELLKDNRLATLEQENKELLLQIARLKDELTVARNTSGTPPQTQSEHTVPKEAPPSTAQGTPSSSKAEENPQVLELKQKALDIKNRIINRLGVVESSRAQEAPQK
ncbi:MAG: tetratricopeptide repeat protein [Treponemataceae bacterium]|nr:tetratricopeptide repeat protein [Treponemataceae bacterium]